MRFGAVLVGASTDAFVAASATLEIHDQDALTFIKPLLDESAEERSTIVLIANTRERLLDETAAKDREPSNQFEEVRAADRSEPWDIVVIGGGATGASFMAPSLSGRPISGDPGGNGAAGCCATAGHAAMRLPNVPASSSARRVEDRNAMFILPDAEPFLVRSATAQAASGRRDD